MKKYILSLLAVAFMPLATWAQDEPEPEPVIVEINETNFPDANFRAVVETFNTDGEEGLSVAEIAAVTTIDINATETTADADKISDLTGLRYFTALKKIYLDYQNVTSLDLTDFTNLTTVYCRYGKLTSLNLSGLTKLTTVYCEENSLESLNVDGCTKLSSLYCQNNNLTSLTISLAQLKTLNCSYNQLTSLNIDECTGLTKLQCQYNKLTSLNVTSANAKLVYANNNSITEADVTACTDLEDLRLYRNPDLEGVDVSKNENLVSLEIFDCALKSIDVKNNTKLVTLKCSDNQLDEIDLSNNEVLEVLNLHENNFKEVDLSNNPLLRTLTIYDNQISEVKVSHLSDLTYFRCNHNLLKEIDVTKCTKLKTFTCNNNELTQLDVTQCPDIVSFRCDNNHLTTLDLSKNTTLTLKLNETLGSGTGGKDYIGSQTAVIDAIVVGDNREKVALPLVPSSSESIVEASQFSDLKLEKSSLDPNLVEANLVMADDPKADVDLYGKTAQYIYNVPCGSSIPTAEQLKMDVTITTYPYVMYVNPASEDLKSGFFSGTLIVDYDAVVPEGAEAYVATGIQLDSETMIMDGDKVTFDQLTMTKVGDAGDVIPANTPIYVKAATASGLYAFGRNIDELETEELPANNILEGTLVDKSVSPGEVLTLGRETKKGTKAVGFWAFLGSTVPAHRVFIDSAILQSTDGANGFTLNFDGSCDGINTVYTTTAADGTYYTLQGIKVSEPTQKGVYIHNGKKIMVK